MSDVRVLVAKNGEKSVFSSSFVASWSSFRYS
jgi:hypothetical protein